MAENRERVFLSYATIDRDRVQILRQQVGDVGYFPFIDAINLRPGQDWERKLRREIQRCDVFVYVITTASAQSDWCRWEFRLAARQGKPILPLLLDPDAWPYVPQQLQRHQYLAVPDLSDLPIDRIVQGIHSAEAIRWWWLLALLGMFADDPEDRTDRERAPQPSNTPDPGDPLMPAQSYDRWRRRRLQRQIGALIGVLGVVGTVASLALDIPELLRTLRGGGDILPFPTAVPGETLILVTGFTEQGVEVDTRIYRELRSLIAEEGLPLRVEHLPDQTPTLPDEALALGESAGASLVIWGTADSLSFEPQISLTSRSSLRPVETEAVLASDVALYSAYIVNDAPAEFEYLLRLILGQTALQNGDLSGAHLYFDQAISSVDPARLKALNAGVAFFYRGYTFSRLGDSSRALEDYTQAITLDPSLVEAYSNRALILARFGQLDEAVADATQAIDLDPEVARSWRVRGYLRLLQGDYAGTISDLDEALRLYPNSSDALNNRAYALARSGGDLDQALRDIDEALRLDAARATYHDTRGLILLLRGDPAGAIQAYQQALALDPPESAAWFGLGQAYESAGQPILALDAYRRYLSEVPGGSYGAQAEERIAALGG